MGIITAQCHRQRCSIVQRHGNCVLVSDRGQSLYNFGELDYIYIFFCSCVCCLYGIATRENGAGRFSHVWGGHFHCYRYCCYCCCCCCMPYHPTENYHNIDSDGAYAAIRSQHPQPHQFVRPTPKRERKRERESERVWEMVSIGQWWFCGGSHKHSHTQQCRDALVTLASLYIISSQHWPRYLYLTQHNPSISQKANLHVPSIRSGFRFW